MNLRKNKVIFFILLLAIFLMVLFVVYFIVKAKLNESLFAFKTIAFYGSCGTGEKQFNEPKGIASSHDGSLVACDFRNARIQVILPDGRLKLSFGSRGAEAGQFSDPTGVACDSQGNIYVADTWNHRVQKFSPHGEFLMQITGHFFAPKGIALDGEGIIYVVDTGHKMIKRFSPQGVFLGAFGGGGNLPGQLMEPVGIHVFDNGNILVADTGNRRLQLFDNKGNYLSQLSYTEVDKWGESYIAVDGDIIYVTLPMAKEIKAARISGNKMSWLRYVGEKPDLIYVCGICIGKQGKIYAVDATRCRIAVLSRKPTRELTKTALANIMFPLFNKPKSWVNPERFPFKVYFLGLACLAALYIFVFHILMPLLVRTSLIKDHSDEVVGEDLLLDGISERLPPRKPLSHRFRDSISHKRHLLFLILAANISLAMLGELFLMQEKILAGALTMSIACILFIVIYDSKVDVIKPAKGMPIIAEILLFCIILALGLFFRLYRISEIPPGLHSDSAWNILEAIGFMQGRPYLPFSYFHWGQETLYFLIMSLVFRMHGVSVLSMRLTSVMIGMVGLIFVYLLARLILGNRYAFIAAFFMASFPGHVSYSRTGLRGILLPTILLIGLYFLLLGFHKHRRIYYFLGGLGIGLCTHTYLSGKGIPLIVLGWFLLLALTKRGFLRRYIGSLFIVILGILVSYGPLLIYTIQEGLFTSARAQYLFVGNRIKQVGSFAPLWENLSNWIKTFYVQGGTGSFLIPLEPLLNLSLVIAFTFGLLLAFKNWRRIDMMLLLFIFWGTSLPSLLSVPSYVRMIGVTPMIFLLAAIFYAWLHEFLKMILPKAGTGIFVLLVAVSLGAGLVQDYRYYFKKALHDGQFCYGYYAMKTEAGKFIKKHLPDYDFYVSEELALHDTIRYYGYDFSEPVLTKYKHETTPAFPIFELKDVFPISKRVDKGVAIVLTPSFMALNILPKYIKEFYPEAHYFKGHNPLPGKSHEIAYIAYLIPHEAIIKRQSLKIEYYDSKQHKLIHSDKISSLNILWDKTPKGIEGSSFNIRISGSIYIPKLERYRFKLWCNAFLSASIDEYKAQPADEIGEYSLNTMLSPGLHQVDILVENASVGTYLKCQIGVGEGAMKDIPYYWLNPNSNPSTYLKGEPVRKTNYRYVLSSIYGHTGHDDASLRDPHDFVISKDNEIIVADGARYKIKIFSHNGELIRLFGKKGHGDGGFEIPINIGLAPENQILVASEIQQAIYSFDQQGNYLGVFFTGEGKNPGVVKDIATDSKGNLYFADANAHQIWIYSPQGKFLKSIGNDDKNPVILKRPVSVAIDSNDNIYVADKDLELILKYNPNGDLAWSIPCNRIYERSRLCIDRFDSIILSATEDNSILVYDQSGNRLVSDDRSNKFSVFYNETFFNHPGEIEMDAEGNIYIADRDNDVIKKFSPVVE